MANEGEAQPGSSWRRWTSGRAEPDPTDEATDAAAAPVGGVTAAPPPPPPPARNPFQPASADDARDDADLDVMLEWPETDDRLAPHDTAGLDLDDPDDPADEDDEDDDGWPPEPDDDDAPAGGWDDVDDDDEDALAGVGEPLLPAMASRIDSVQGGIGSLAMRLESLIAATGTMRSTLSDRVEEYSATVSRLALNSAHDLDEYRRTTERSMGELRRAALATDQAISGLSARTEELGSDVAALTDLVRSLADDVRTSAQAARTRPAQEPAATALAEPPAAGPVSQDDLLDVADAVDALRGELGLLRVRIEALTSIAEAGAPPAPASELDPGVAAVVGEVRALRSEVAALHGAVAARPEPATASGPAPAAAPAADPGALAEIRELLAILVDTLPDSQEGSGDVPAVLRDIKAGVERLGDRPQPAIDLEALADALAARLEFVVDDDTAKGG